MILMLFSVTVAEGEEVAMPNGLLLRKRIEALSGPELSTLRNAYARMQGIMDNRGYNYWAGGHGVPQW